MEMLMDSAIESTRKLGPESSAPPASSRRVARAAERKTELGDDELMAHAKEDDREAFALLVDRYKDRVVNYLTRLTGSRDRAEDFAQETFLRLYQGLDAYREEGALLAYLMRIATNLVRSAERRRNRWKILEPIFKTSGFRGGHGMSGGVERVGQSPQSRALASEAQRQVAQAITSLDILYRAPVVLREIEGLSYREIARALEVNEGTIKSRIHRARALLQEKLTPYWKGGGHTDD